MKKLFCALFLMLTICVSVCAEPSVSNEEVLSYLQQYISSKYDYCDITYNERLNSFYVGIATDGLTRKVVDWLKNGYNESYEPWIQIKESILGVESFIIDYYKSIGRDDLHVMVSLLNDDAYIRNDYTSISINPLFCVTNNSVGYYNAVAVDCMAEFSRTEAEKIEYSNVSDDLLLTSLQSVLDDQFAYCNVRYLGDSQYWIVIDLGIDGMTEQVKISLDAGHDANHEPWVQFKEQVLSFYDDIVVTVEKAGEQGFCKKDMGIILNIVNEKIKLNNDYSVLSADKFLTISSGNVYFDYLGAINGY